MVGEGEGCALLGCCEEEDNGFARCSSLMYDDHLLMKVKCVSALQAQFPQQTTGNVFPGGYRSRSFLPADWEGYK